ncbi:MAG: tetraacyldisaccharide 4'-kinase [Sulfuritalea sp.]|nr:tetraacyldisaccharide 4'-kinase [Sulfuritalea sp.]
MSCKRPSRPGCRIFPLPSSERSADTGGFVAIWRRRGLVAWLLFPVSILFLVLVTGRRALYRLGWLRRFRLPVSVVVIGNINVGGTGKTPLVVHLAQSLLSSGRHPGIVSRGYLGNTENVVEASPESDPGEVGDEPVLLARLSGCAVFVGRDRVAAARALLATNPDCDVILSDDGLQHYRLERDVEIAIFDAGRMQNGWMLPAGPLREPMDRLNQVDAVVINATAVSPAPTFACPTFVMSLQGSTFFRLDDPLITCSATELTGKALHAVAGIGEPRRFFDMLSNLGLSCSEHSFADHYDYRAEDIGFPGDAILTTEKDAVKLARLKLSLPVWVLPVAAEVSPALTEFVLEKLHGYSSS